MLKGGARAGTGAGLWHILSPMTGKNEDLESISARAMSSIDRFILHYSEAVAAAHRKVGLTGRKCRNPRIINTLLGFELQIRDRRFTCPDMATARFLRIFAKIGVSEVMVPLDPTLTADILPEIEKNWNEFSRICRELESGERKALARRLHDRLKAKVRGTEHPASQSGGSG